MAKYFVRVPDNVIENKDLSLGAKGLLLFMLSKPKGWQFTQDNLAKQTGHGIDFIKARTKELKEHNLIKWCPPKHDSEGKFLRGNWELLCWDRKRIK